MPKLFSSLPEKNFLVKLCDGIITVSVALVFLLVPVFFTGLAAQGYVFEKIILFYLLVLAAVVAWVTKGVAQGELKVVRTPLDIPLLGLAAVLLVSAFFSVDTLSSFVGSFGSATKTFIAFLLYVTFYYVVVNNLTNRRIAVYLWSLVVGALAVIGYSALQISEVFILPLAVTQAASFNPIGSASSLGVYVAAMIPLLSVCVPALLREQTTDGVLKKTLAFILRVAAGLGVAAALFVLFLLNNFMLWPAAVFGMVIVLMFALAKVVALKPADMALPITAFIALIIFLVGGNFNLVTAQLPSEVSLTRELSWSIAKQSLARDPLFGSGPATFDYAFVKYRGPDFNVSELWNVRFDSAAGFIFELLATVGVLGFFGFAAIALIIISTVFIYLTKSKSGERKLIVLGVFASLAVLASNAALVTVTGTIVLALAICTALMMALVVEGYPEKFKEFVLSFRSSPKYALALASLFLLVSAGVVVLFTSGFKIYLADFYALKAVQSSDSAAAVDYLNRAIATADYQDQYYLRLSRLYMNMANQEAAKGGTSDVSIVQQYMSLAITAGQRAAELAPNSVVNKESLALLYENAASYNTSGALEWAEKYYTEVTQLEPDNPAAYIRLALINMAHAAAESAAEEQNHFYDQAIGFYNQAIEKKSNLASAYYGLAVVYERKGDYTEAITRIVQAVELAPTNLDYRFELGRMFFNRGISAAPAAPAAPAVATDNDDLRNARAIFENILAVSPGHANAVYSMALIAESLGDREQAIGYYERLLGIVNDQPTKDAILEKLRSL